MSPLQALAVAAAGVAAGGINTLVGSGTLVTFPVLLAVGLPPVTANVSNTLGLVPGSVSGAVGYRRELSGQRSRLLLLGSLSALGGLVGAVLLLVLPPAAFKAVVPVLVALACVLVVLQPRIAARAAARQRDEPRTGGPLLWVGVLGSGVYGGYFGAAQGVLLIGMMGALLDESLQRINAAKNVLAALVNGTAAVVFACVAHVDWVAALLLAVGSTLGGVVAGRYGRQLPAPWLRGLVVVIGLCALVSLLR
ncbi:hypothetical protein EV189_3148 [Motilibacter rhizosphaerae]|uniref:Probable membrane transporter protein n=1 Tax=Motilibacter rhizosphaerae TaxID=598652 RepID=A0A4V2F3D7_9ACTN|nr:sulfite exporter TauE/SafE family protein [Motilibacter rhizosphaerae]RZS82753.1 hypothetical protein EV189_3148 [Motilibacter rhizosphaerae]